MTMHRWLFVGLALMAAVGGVGSALVSGNHPKNPQLGLELIAMSRETSAGGFVVDVGPDQNSPFARPTIPDIDDLRERVKSAEELAAEHLARLEEIVAQYGWPGKRLVGRDGAHAAWELLMRSDDVAFQERALGLMRQLPRGEVEARDVAVLTDRIAVRTRKPQTYGTQLGCSPETGQLGPIGGLIDPDNVDRRRAEVGLPTMSEEFGDSRSFGGACGFREAPVEEPLRQETAEVSG